MPPTNTIKTFVKDGYYHVYNRGVNKNKIFLDKNDYLAFLNILKTSLSTPPPKDSKKVTFTLKGTSFKGIPKQPKNYVDEIEMICFCLMPNHYHLMVKQNSNRSLESFMRSVSTRYVLYFNKKHNRVGPLFQGIYKAVLVESESYLLHLTRYIHLNPTENSIDIADAYSSYAAYIGKTKMEWIKPDVILSYFDQNKLPELKNTNSYKGFVENQEVDSLSLLKKVAID